MGLHQLQLEPTGQQQPMSIHAADASPPGESGGGGGSPETMGSSSSGNFSGSSSSSPSSSSSSGNGSPASSNTGGGGGRGGGRGAPSKPQISRLHFGGSGNGKSGATSSGGSSAGSTTGSSSSSNVTAFLSKLWRMVNDNTNGELVRWSQSGCGFVIVNQIQFAKDLLPLYFKHSNMASFIRQLNMYGFRKIPIMGGLSEAARDGGGTGTGPGASSGASSLIAARNAGDLRTTDVAQFYHVNFMRGQEQRLASIKRKNNSCKTRNLVVNSTFCEEVRAVLTDVKSIRDGQTSCESIMGAIQHDNKSLWHDVSLLRTQHQKQRRFIERLVQFLLSLIQSRSNGGCSNGTGSGRGVKRRKMKFMISQEDLQTASGFSMECDDDDNLAASSYGHQHSAGFNSGGGGGGGGSGTTTTVSTTAYETNGGTGGSMHYSRPSGFNLGPIVSPASSTSSSVSGTAPFVNLCRSAAAAAAAASDQMSGISEDELVPGGGSAASTTAAAAAAAAAAVALAATKPNLVHSGRGSTSSADNKLGGVIETAATPSAAVSVLAHSRYESGPATPTRYQRTQAPASEQQHPMMNNNQQQQQSSRRSTPSLASMGQENIDHQHHHHHHSHHQHHLATHNHHQMHQPHAQQQQQQQQQQQHYLSSSSSSGQHQHQLQVGGTGDLHPIGSSPMATALQFQGGGSSNLMHQHHLLVHHGGGGGGQTGAHSFRGAHLQQQQHPQAQHSPQHYNQMGYAAGHQFEQQQQASQMSNCASAMQIVGPNGLLMGQGTAAAAAAAAVAGQALVSRLAVSQQRHHSHHVSKWAASSSQHSMSPQQDLNGCGGPSECGGGGSSDIMMAFGGGGIAHSHSANNNNNNQNNQNNNSSTKTTHTFNNIYHTLD